MAGKVMQSRYAGECVVCHVPFPAGDTIEYTKGEGARHIACRGKAATAKVITQRVCKFKRSGLTDERQKDIFWIRVVDPTDATQLVGQQVVVTKANGDTADIVLGPLVRAVSKTEAFYEKAKVVNNLPGPDQVPAGRYCVPILHPKPGGNDFLFINVWRKGEDRVGCYMVLGPRESTKLNTKRALERIQEVGVAEAAEEYGRRVRNCAICNARLTNRLSRELCIGPVCGGRVHDDEKWGDMKAEARARIRADGFEPTDSVDDDYEFDWTQIIAPQDADELLGSVSTKPPQMEMAEEPAYQASMLDPVMLATVKQLYSSSTKTVQKALEKGEMHEYVVALRASGEIE